MKIKVTDVLAIICFSWALYYINFGKEAVNSLNETAVSSAVFVPL